MSITANEFDSNHLKMRKSKCVFYIRTLVCELVIG